MSALPAEITTNVLSRLPVKSLLRFRCVSKPWCSEIDDPYFIKLHLNLSTATNVCACIPESNQGNQLVSVDYESTLISRIRTPHAYTHVCGSSNGLLLLEGEDGLCFFNPSTHKYFVLQYMPEPCEYFRLGYDAIHDDYKVFSILDERSIISKIRVYSLKSKSWRLIKDFSYGDVPSCKDWWGSYINGALHSIHEIADPVNSRNIVGREIIALDIDIEAEGFRFMPLPESMNNMRSGCIMNDELRGCLCVFNILGISELEIWLMREYGVKESWTRLLSLTSFGYSSLLVDGLAPLYGFPDLVLVFYSEIRNEVVMMHDKYYRRKFVWYDLKTGMISSEYEFIRPLIFPYKRPVKACVSSLVPVNIL